MSRVTKYSQLRYSHPEVNNLVGSRYSNTDYATVTFDKTVRDMTREEVQAALEFFDAILADWPEGE